MFRFRMRVFMLDLAATFLPLWCIIPLLFETLINSVTILSTIITKESAPSC